jgi:hypothetical protein
VFEFRSAETIAVKRYLGVVLGTATIAGGSVIGLEMVSASLIGRTLVLLAIVH